MSVDSIFSIKCCILNTKVTAKQIEFTTGNNTVMTSAILGFAFATPRYPFGEYITLKEIQLNGIDVRYIIRYIILCYC